MAHPKRDQMIAAAMVRLRRHMHAFDPTMQAAAAMSEAKADGKFKEELEELLRQIVTDYNPADDIDRAQVELQEQGRW